MTFRTKIFLTALTSAAIALAASALLVSWSVRRSLEDRIQHELISEARLASETLSHRTAATETELDAEADALGRILSARVTFIAPDGRVVGDSELNADQIRAVENHGTRPEIIQAREQGVGTSRRHSTTLGTDMLYVAIPVHDPGAPLLAWVRLALPLTEVDEQLRSVRRLSLVGFGLGMLAALLLTWRFSDVLGRRVRAIADVATRYAAGDLSKPARDYGDDEIGTVARVLDDSVRDLERRVGELASDRARMEAILSGMTEGVLVVNDRERLQLANDAARRMLKLPDAAEGRHYLEIVRQPAVADQIAAALAGRPNASVELTGAREPGVTFIARAAPVQAGGGRGAVVVLHDITDLRRTDQIRRDFVANVSHELRTPLTAVRGYVEALLDGPPSQDEARRFLEIIGRHTLRMERLVRDLLRLARLEAGQEALDRAPTSIPGLLDGVETELAEAIAARRVRIERRIDADASTVDADPAKLHDGLRNLLENAVNYSPDGGTITFASSLRDGRVAITVGDEGPGIPEADLSRVFERFYRVDKARSRGSRDPGGTGLGLAIVKHLVEAHGGRVTAANRTPRGALFTIDLPG